MARYIVFHHSRLRTAVEKEVALHNGAINIRSPSHLFNHHPYFSSPPSVVSTPDSSLNPTSTLLLLVLIYQTYLFSQRHVRVYTGRQICRFDPRIISTPDCGFVATVSPVSAEK
jgi:hypothetical protein